MTETEEKKQAFLKRFPNPPKIMACIPTYAPSAELASAVFFALNAQIYPNLSIAFLDTNPTAEGEPYERLPELVTRYLPNQKTTILPTTTKKGASAHQIITEAREQLRQHFLASDADYLFFLDDDIILPSTAIATLFSHQKPVVVGVYLNPMALKGPTREVLPCVFVDLPVEGKIRPVQILEVMPPTVFPIRISGFGCSLFRREVMEGSSFVFDPASKTTEDTPFFLDLQRRGIISLCDTRVKCRHLKFPLGDDRNNYLDFEHYKLQFVP